MFFCVSVFILLRCIIIAVHAQDCKDIDATACQTMSQARPDLCSDLTVAKTACPKFCNLCPIECFHCNATVRDYHQCNTTMTCQEGQICMIKELNSIFDGHHEYEMTCAEKQACDNPWNGAGVFGRRHLVTRDLTVTCCMNDLCNYPTPFKPVTSCVRDLILVVDESHKLHQNESTVMQFLFDIVNGLPVNDKDVNVALGLFSNTFRSIFDLDELTTKTETLTALRSQTLKGTHEGDSLEGLKYVLNHALTPAAGDRPEAPNVVVFITAHGTSHGFQIRAKEHEIHNKAEVISVEIGQLQFHHLASETSLSFKIPSTLELHQLLPTVKDSICKSL